MLQWCEIIASQHWLEEACISLGEFRNYLSFTPIMQTEFRFENQHIKSLHSLLVSEGHKIQGLLEVHTPYTVRKCHRVYDVKTHAH